MRVLFVVCNELQLQLQLNGMELNWIQIQQARGYRYLCLAVTFTFTRTRTHTHTHIYAHTHNYPHHTHSTHSTAQAQRRHTLINRHTFFIQYLRLLTYCALPPLITTTNYHHYLDYHQPLSLPRFAPSPSALSSPLLTPSPPLPSSRSSQPLQLANPPPFVGQIDPCHHLLIATPHTPHHTTADRDRDRDRAKGTSIHPIQPTTDHPPTNNKYKPTPSCTYIHLPPVPLRHRKRTALKLKRYPGAK